LKVISISDLRGNIAGHFDSISADAEALVVTRSGHEPMVVIPKAEYDAWRETEYLLSGENGRVLRKRIADLDAGRGTRHDLREADDDTA
jgi:antitoxin YefM